MRKGLTLEELEALSGLPADTIQQGVYNGLFDGGWLLELNPPRFHEKTPILLARTMPLLGLVEQGKMTMERFHAVLWTVAQAGPGRLIEYLAPPDNRTVQAMLAGHATPARA